MSELIIAEKPSQAAKIAEALADKTPKKHVENKVSYYEITHKGKKIFIGCAVGHLFNLTEKDKKGWTYPVFKTQWVPSYKLSKSAEFTKKYIKVLENLAKESDSFIIACDYDLEGSLIGFNVLRFICHKKDGKRMKFSTLTKPELQKSYKNASKHLDFPLIESGESRHLVDWLAGINLSRALTLAIKNATNSFKIMSSGRVQGPTLKILADRELEIQKFKPIPFWELEALGEINSKHKKGKFWDEKEVNKIYEKIKDEGTSLIKKITKKSFSQPPPFPFDLTSLQLESYRCFKISPKDTLALAQELYTSAYISYPRTSSNQLPPSLNIKKIIQDLAKQSEYKELAEQILKTKITPNNGKKTDPAHPAIHPTGIIPKKLSERAKKIYDLIVRRTLATFAEPAKRETLTILLDIKKEPFIASGSKTVYPGWHIFYGKYTNVKEEELPDVKENQIIKIEKINLLSKETQPPKRYTPASIIKALESKKLGTKATRSQIIEALYQRNYIIDQQIKVTDLGLKTIQTLQKFCPDIIDEKMTRDLETHMEQITEGKKTKEQVLEEAKKDLTKILKKFKKNELEIGKSLLKAIYSTQEQTSILGQCPNCEKGKLRILYSKKTKKYFAACNAYPKCKTTFSLPQGKIQPTNKTCQHCKLPIIKVIRKGKRPFTMCLTIDCKSKEHWKNNKK